MQALGRWRAGPPALVVLMGWAMALAGLYRMGWPAAAQAGAGVATYALLAVLLAIGAVLTWHGYRRGGR